MSLTVTTGEEEDTDMGLLTGKGRNELMQWRGRQLEAVEASGLLIGGNLPGQACLPGFPRSLLQWLDLLGPASMFRSFGIFGRTNLPLLALSLPTFF